MTYYIFGVTLITLFSVLFYCLDFYSKNKFTLLSLLKLCLMHILLFYILIVPVLNHQLLFYFILLIVNFRTIYIRSKEDKSKINTSISVLIKVVYMVYMFIYLPLSILYFYRYHDRNTMIIQTSLILLVVYGLAFIFYYFKENIFIRNLIKFQFVVFGIVSVGLLLVVTRTSYIKNENREFLYDYKSENLFSLEVDVTSTKIHDFSYDDTYVYYIMDNYNEDEITLNIFNKNTNELVFTKVLSEEVYSLYDFNRNSVFKEFNNKTYLFLDEGVYLFDNNEMVMISTINGYIADKFIVDNELYIYSETTRTMYKMEQDDLSLVDTLSLNNTFVSNNHLYYFKDNNLKRYGSDISYDVSEYTEIEGLTDEYYLFGEGDSLFIRSYDVLDSDSKLKTVFQTEYYNNEHYMSSLNGEYMSSVDSGPLQFREKNFTFDSQFNRMNSYVPVMLDETQEFSRSSALYKVMDDSFVYVVTNYNYKDHTQKLYFEINKLVDQDGILEFDIVTIDYTSYVYILFATLLFVVNGSTFKSIKEESKQEQISNEDIE